MAQCIAAHSANTQEIFHFPFLWISPVHVSEELFLTSAQPVFEHDGRNFSNALLLHRLVATGQEEQVVSRRGEINRDLVKHTCTMDSYSKVR